MVWGARIAGIFFLADDYIDSGKMLDRIPGFKKAATGEGVSQLFKFLRDDALTFISSRFTLAIWQKSAMTRSSGPCCVSL